MSYNSRDYLGNEAVNGDGKPPFLLSIADWIEEWTNERVPKCLEISLSAQTSAAIARTFRCHASLIDDLMKNRYNICAKSLLSK